jgi:putative oxidoreductase
MPITRLISRPMLASMFIAGGIDQLRDPGSKAKQAETVTKVVADRVSFLPKDPETLVRINGGVQVAAGAMLAIGRLPRLSAALLAGSLVPTTLAEHAFWSEQDEQARAAQQVHFMKNVAMMGGLLVAASDAKANKRIVRRAERRQEKARDKAAAAARKDARRHPDQDPDDHHALSGAATLAAAAELARHARHLIPDVDRHELTSDAAARLAETAGKVKLAAGAARHLLPDDLPVADLAGRVGDTAGRLRTTATAAGRRAMDAA